METTTVGEMAVLDKTGDTKVTWDRTKSEEVDAARATFDALRQKGYAAFAVSKDGSKGEQIRTFDPTAERIILAPALVGG